MTFFASKSSVIVGVFFCGVFVALLFCRALGRGQFLLEKQVLSMLTEQFENVTQFREHRVRSTTEKEHLSEMNKISNKKAQTQKN